MRFDRKERFRILILILTSKKKETVTDIESLADTITKSKSAESIKKALVKGIPRQAVLKPSHVVYRLQNQHFDLGDRVTMVQDSGGVPLSVKGVVVGLNPKSMDVVWDVPFMSGVTLGDRSEFFFYKMRCIRLFLLTVCFSLFFQMFAISWFDS
jgi:Xrn1 SH3-like domain/Exoribonuclease 1 Domain-3